MIEKDKIPTSIEGVWLQPLRVIPAQGGPVLHFLRSEYALMPTAGIGEIYFSEVLPGCIKAWKKHRRQGQLFAVPSGQLFIALYDTRNGRQRAGILLTMRLGRPDNYCLLSIPPGVWYGFAPIGGEPALICNCADLPHDPDEAERLPHDSKLIPFSWVSAAKELSIPSD